MRNQAGGVLIEFALGLSVLTTVLIALLEIGRISWLLTLWAGMVIETARAVSLCPVGGIDLAAIASVTGLPVSPTNLEIDYLPVNCQFLGCQRAIVKILPDSVGAGLINAWWPVALPSTSMTVGLESARPFAHPFCPH